MTRYIPQGKEVMLDISFFKEGLQALEDQSKTPVGSFEIMEETQITDRGGVGPRKGTELIGDSYEGDKFTTGFHNFKLAHESKEILIRNLGSQTHALDMTNKTLGWFTVKDGNTDSKEWGYVTSIVNTSDQDLLIGGSRYDPMISWTGRYALLTADASTSDTEITVDSTLQEESFYQGTVDSSIATSITVDPDEGWAVGQWVGFHVHMTSGTLVGTISKITANDSDSITFDAMAGSPTGTFEIRRAKFVVGESLKIGTDQYVISAIDAVDTINITTGLTEDRDSGTVASDAFKTYPGNPRGNRFTNWLTRILVGNVRSAAATTTGTTREGYASGGSTFVSKISDPLDFSYSIPRTAGQGDIISSPYGGGNISDVAHFEKGAYIFKADYIESITYTQDGNDLVQREPLKENVGSVGRVIVGSDDIYFITADNEFTSIGRAANKDLLPQTANIGYKIKRILDDLVFDEVAGEEYKNKVYITCKRDSESTENDTTLVWNKQHRAFEAVWNIGFFNILESEGDLYGALSFSGDVVKLLTGTSDRGLNISTSARTNFFNLISSKSNLQAVSGAFFEGITDDFAEVTIQFFKDNEPDAFIEFKFVPGEGDEEFTNTIIEGSYLGQQPLGLEPMGSFTSVVTDGRRRFFFRIYFPFTYGRYYAFGWSNSGQTDYEFLNIGMILKEEYNFNTKSIKDVV